MRTVRSHEKLTEIGNHSNHCIKTSITRTFNETKCNSTTEINKVHRPDYEIEIKNCHHYHQRQQPDADKDQQTKLSLPTCKLRFISFFTNKRKLIPC